MSKFCTYCGSEVNEQAVVCVKCGCMIENTSSTDSLSTFKNSKKDFQLSFVLGIIGIVLAWLFALFGHIISIIGIVIGYKEYQESSKTTGVILSIIGEVCSVISSIIGVIIYL